MKYHLIISFLLLFAVPAGAQLNYVLLSDDGTLEQRVKGILGKYCEDVSNVSLIGSQSGVRSFYNSEEIGLKGGMVFTTGFAPSSAAPELYSSNLGKEGDLDISASFNPDQATFDANGIQFELNPTVSDTMRMRYVFASEEYPDYVGSQFNDRFLFLVSTNNGPYVNIAKLPNNQDVSINNVNNGLSNSGPCSNCAYYVANNNNQAPNYTLFPYNGYTVPMVAKFYAQAGNHYRIKIVVADVVDEVVDSAIYLEEIIEAGGIPGDVKTVATNDVVPAGYVELYRKKSLPSIQQPDYRVSVDANGEFSIDSLISGKYRVRYVPEVGSTDYYPMYLGNKHLWENGDLLTYDCLFDSLKLFSEHIPVTDAPGSISGIVVRDSLENQTNVSPYEGAVVYAWNLETDQPAAITYTDVEGKYTLGNLPNGYYRIAVDIPFIAHTDYYELEIRNEIDSVREVKEYFVRNKYIKKRTTIVSSFSFYPNPTNGAVVLVTENYIDSKLRVYNHLGQLVDEVLITSDVQYFDTEHLSEGLYFLQLGDMQPVERLMITDDSKE
ncbi:MAG: choice-of-anchor L domain-containing protein [Bacteroidota bacterium]